MIKKFFFLRQIHLIISIMIVLPVGLVYGFKPNLFFDVTLNSLDESSIFKALMGIYLGFSLLWILGVFNTNYWRTATVSNIIFMLGLAFGRIVSLVVDGFPSVFFLFGTLGELILGFYAFYQLKIQNKL